MALILSLISIPVRGITIAFLWLWFVVPLGAPNINLPEALGLSTIIALFTMSTSDLTAVKEKKVSATESAIYMLVVYMFALIFGYIYHILGAGITA